MAKPRPMPRTFKGLIPGKWTVLNAYRKFGTLLVIVQCSCGNVFLHDMNDAPVLGILMTCDSCGNQNWMTDVIPGCPVRIEW